MQYRIMRLNLYIRGWTGYFRLAANPRTFPDLDEWFRRRMRQIRWKEWKLARSRVAHLGALGIRADLAWQWGMSSHGYWRTSRFRILYRALPTQSTQYWEDLGLVLFHQAWTRFQRPNDPP